ncbi:MAG: hypothetical protein KI785_15935 [Devosiaceae bacterium]|nr:hypothetical protein [Devosiaceae bacterium MH13]
MNVVNRPQSLPSYAPRPERPTKVLGTNDLTRWSADELGLAIALARRPASFVGGISGVRVALQPLLEHEIDPVLAHVPLETPDGHCTLHVSAEALDALAGLMSPHEKSVKGLGRSVSLDALEALLVGLLAPVDGLKVGRAAWIEEPVSGASAAIRFGTATMPVWGASAGLVTLYRLIAATDRGLHSPALNPSTGSAAKETVGVQAERLFGQVELSPQERVALEVGGGILVDTVWPNGLVALGRKFVKVGGGWREMPNLRKGKALVLRANHAIQALSDPELGLLPPSNRQLDLVDGHTVIGTGRLVPGRVDERDTLIFKIDQLH